MDNPKQGAMFEQGEDLPLFSGTPQTARVAPFKQEEVSQQKTLPGMRPTWQDLGKTARK